ncbi:MAG TPA: dienelactone hydrolase family protein [Acidimicrobiales bacterium]
MRITLPSGTPAELARPASGAEPTAGLVVVPDIGGLRPLFDDMAARLATEQGWAVCVFELWPGREDLPLPERLGAGGTLDDARVLGDAVAAADATGCDRVTLIGFCMGGMYALKAARTGRFARVASFYGMARVPEAWRSPTQGEPLEAVSSPGAAPVLAVAGTADQWLPPDDVDALEAAGAEVVRYEGADHGFVHDPSRPTHRPDDAADAWSRVIAHLRAA